MQDLEGQTTQDFETLIRYGKPSVEAGVFLAYIDPFHHDPYADRQLMIYAYGKWSFFDSALPFTGEVHAWIGPFPSLLISSLSSGNIQ